MQKEKTMSEIFAQKVNVWPVNLFFESSRNRAVYNTLEKCVPHSYVPEILFPSTGLSFRAVTSAAFFLDVVPQSGLLAPLVFVAQ